MHVHVLTSPHLSGLARAVRPSLISIRLPGFNPDAVSGGFSGSTGILTPDIVAALISLDYSRLLGGRRIKCTWRGFEICFGSREMSVRHVPLLPRRVWRAGGWNAMLSENHSGAESEG